MASDTRPKCFNCGKAATRFCNSCVKRVCAECSVSYPFCTAVICLNCNNSDSDPGDIGGKCPNCGTRTEDQIIFSLVKDNDYSNLKLALDQSDCDPNVMERQCFNEGGTPGSIYKLRTPLYYAVRSGYTDVVALLISSGARVTVVAEEYPDKHTDLFELADESNKDNSHDEIISLLSSSLETGQLDKSDLPFLSKKGFTKQIKQIVENEVIDPATRDNFGFTMLDYAIFGQHLELAGFLLGKWLNVYLEHDKSYVFSSVANDGYDENHQLFDLLIDKGFNDHSIDYEELPLWTSIHMAVWLNNGHVLKRLVETGTDINELRHNVKTETPLNHAVGLDRTEMVQFILSLGADVNIRDEMQATALHLAVLNRNVRMVEMLIESGSDVYALDKEGKTPVHYLVMTSPYNVNEDEKMLSRNIKKMMDDEEISIFNLYEILVSEGHLESMSQIIGLLTESVILKKDYLNARDNSDRSAFADAVLTDKILAALALKKAGAWDKHVDEEQLTKLYELQLMGPWTFG